MYVTYKIPSPPTNDDNTQLKYEVNLPSTSESLYGTNAFVNLKMKLHIFHGIMSHVILFSAFNL